MLMTEVTACKINFKQLGLVLFYKTKLKVCIIT